MGGGWGEGGAHPGPGPPHVHKSYMPMPLISLQIRTFGSSLFVSQYERLSFTLFCDREKDFIETRISLPLIEKPQEVVEGQRHLASMLPCRSAWKRILRT